MDEITDVVKPLKFNFTNIYGVPRGGLFMALLLSYRLKLPIILQQSKISDRTLIVDDISDTGKTLTKVMKKNSMIITLWSSTKTKVHPYHVCRTMINDWVVFPWETLTSSKRDNTI